MPKNPPSVDQGEYDNYEEITDVRKMRERLDLIYHHIRDGWYADEARDALSEIMIADSALGRFEPMAEAHRERVLRETEIPKKGDSDA